MFAVLTGGCDTFGSDTTSNNEPDWIGNWEGVDAKPDEREYPPEGTRILFTITTDSITTYLESGLGCEIGSVPIVNVDDNVVTTIEDEDDADPDTTKARLEASNDTLRITPLETGDDQAFDEIIAESIDAEPDSLVDCSRTGEQAEVEAFFRNH